MFQKISREYIDFCIRRQTKQAHRQKRYSNLKDVSNVLLLISSNDISEKELQKIRKMIGETKQITSWIYNSGETALQESVNAHIFNKKEVSFFQKPIDKVEKRFLAGKYDLLIDLTTEEILPLKYLLGISNVQCRCGMRKDGYNLYDLEIEEPSKVGETELLEQILFYLSSIQAKL